MRIGLVIAGLLVAVPALAGEPPIPPWAQQQITLQEAMSQAFNLGLSMGRDVARELASRDAKAKELAAWWAAYVAGLKTP